MKNQKQVEAILYSTAGVAIVAASLVAFNVISGVIKTRVDLTQERMFTLSKGTRAILGKLDTPVKVRFYCTRAENSMPVQWKSYAQRVDDLLSEFRQNAKGNLEIERLDPQPDSDAEDSASLDGVEGQMVNLTDKLYLGVAISCLDAKEAIPFLAPERERLLEYDLARAIARVAKPEKTVIGVLSALPVFGMPMNPMMMQMGRQQGSDPWTFISELKRDFQVKQVDLSAEKIDDDIKLLVVIYPKDISDKGQFAIDQYLLKGGKVVAFLDPLSIADNRNSQMNPMQRAGASGATMEKLLKAWGIEFDVSKVVADMNYMTQLARQGRPEPSPAVLTLTPEAMNTNDVTTTEIDTALLAYAGVFSGTPAAGLEQTVLFRSSKNSQLIDKFMAEFSGDQTIKSFAPSGKEQSLAIRLKGKFKTAFPDGKPADQDPKAAEGKDDKKDDAKPGDALKEATGEGLVVLVADSDMIFDPVCVQVANFFGQKIVQPMNGNLSFAQSMVEQLTGDSNLIEVRSRATMSRPFTVVKSMQAEAEAAYRSKIKEIEVKLSEAQQRLTELQKPAEKGQRFILSKEQQDEIARFRKEEANFKQEIKSLRKQLKRDILSLETRLKWLNIAVMPFLVTVSGITLAMIKKKKTAAK